MARLVSGMTVAERQLALAVLLALSLIGLAMAAGGRGDPMGAQGFIVMVFSVGLAFAVMSGYYAPEPDESRLTRY